jgi:ferritin
MYYHEQKVTGLINDLVNLALDERDHATNIFLQWFVSEQVEEEASAGEVLQKLKLIGKDTTGLFTLDQELGQRIFTPPVKGVK